ncbi:MAG: SPOR domain-containing protein [Spirochaetaceae bacterium]|jgi:cell division septation protein DedD|nr:SPOR domain-containing protein [Spirochaetaceae bacterium]
MKKIRIAMGIMAASVFFVSASIWEGAAVVALGDELPHDGYFAATNSFPPNTVVYMTNLENGKTIQAVITAPLDSPIILAMVSQEAAHAMGIQDESITRIRIIQPGESGIASGFAEGIYSEGTAITKGPNQDQRGGIPDKPADVPIPKEFAAETYSWYEDLPDAVVSSLQPEEIKSGTSSYYNESPETLSQTPTDPLGGYDLSLIPAEERPPVKITDSWLLPPDAEIASLNSSSPKSPSEAEIDPSLIISSRENKTTASPIRQTSAPSGEGYHFSVPVIRSLEKGKYYLQLRAFGRVELVEAELSRIGKNYPLVVQPMEGSNGSIYRILLGPVSLGESGALLQRFKGSGYGDAFIRQGIN